MFHFFSALFIFVRFKFLISLKSSSTLYWFELEESQWRRSVWYTILLWASLWNLRALSRTQIEQWAELADSHWPTSTAAVNKEIDSHAAIDNACVRQIGLPHSFGTKPHSQMSLTCKVCGGALIHTALFNTHRTRKVSYTPIRIFSTGSKLTE